LNINRYVFSSALELAFGGQIAQFRLSAGKTHAMVHDFPSPCALFGKLAKHA
jgi:hypothetical protein